MTSPSDGIGNRISDRWHGWLRFDYLSPALQRAEDSTHEADLRYVPPDLLAAAECSPSYPDNLRGYYQYCFDRPATDTELILLASLGFTVPETLSTHVDRVTDSIIRRRWPTLEASAVLPQGVSSL